MLWGMLLYLSTGDLCRFLRQAELTRESRFTRSKTSGFNVSSAANSGPCRFSRHRPSSLKKVDTVTILKYIGPAPPGEWTTQVACKKKVG